MTNSRTPTIIRSLLILETIAKAGRPLSPTEVNESLGLPKQSVHRLCNSLVDYGFLSRQEDGSGLRPSSRSRDIANGLLHGSHVHLLRRQILRAVADKVGETVNFVVPESDGMRYRDRIETDWPLRIQLPVGSNVPFHCTASGKVFLASLSRSKRQKLARELDLRKITPNTIDEAGRLISELDTVRKRGYAVDNEEFMEGMVAVAVPVLDRNKRYFASLAFHCPRQRMDIETALTRVGLLQEAAQRITVAEFSD